MEDGWYRILPKKETSCEIVGIIGNAVDGGHFVQEYLNMGFTFTQVYFVHLPKEMMEWVHDLALRANISDDNVIEEAVRRFILVVKKEEE